MGVVEEWVGLCHISKYKLVRTYITHSLYKTWQSNKCVPTVYQPVFS